MSSFTHTAICVSLGFILAFTLITGSNIYRQAKVYNQMTIPERFNMLVTNKTQYDILVKNYKFVSGLPLIGETL